MDRSAFTDAAKAIGLDLTEEQIGAFAAFEEALYKMNEVMNLTRVPREEAWIRHFLDSLLLVDLIPHNARVLDIGTGPGIPAWPLACARGDIQVTALDSNNKMIGFLHSQPLPNLETEQVRAEEWGTRDTFDFVTGRAVAPLAAQLELSAAACKVGGVVVPMRTPTDRMAIETANLRPLGLKLLEVHERSLPGTDVIRLIPVFVKENPTHPRYPRRWAEIKTKPL